MYKVKVTGSLSHRMCPDCESMHPVANWPNNHARPEERLAAPRIIQDEMPPVQNQHDGKFYTSKRAMRASYLPSGNKEGVRLIEIGDQKQKRQCVKPNKQAIKDSVQRAAARVARGEVTKETYERKVITRVGK